MSSSPDLERLTLCLPEDLVTDFKKAAIDEHANYSKLADRLFRAYLENGRARGAVAAATSGTNGTVAENGTGNGHAYVGPEDLKKPGVKKFGIYLPYTLIADIKKAVVDLPGRATISELAEKLFRAYLGGKPRNVG